ncbi:MAG TPA: ABC transporter permease [Stellaceae bacterium]|nr:ABC transporter permease [Stellaceae bacterium]
MAVPQQQPSLARAPARPGMSVAGAAAALVQGRGWNAVRRVAPRVLWTALSLGLFAGIWELCWALGWADPKLLPPPHIFLGAIAEQAKFFNTVSRWTVGVGQDSGPPPALAVFYTILATTGRVVAGLAIAASLAISTGVAIRYCVLFERLTLPTVTLLAPVSPIAWLPVAIFLFGIGNRPAIFMVVIALFFHMVLATINQIDNVNPNFVNVARTMGATKRQTYLRVIIPAILPQLFVVLRFNLFGAWMVVLVAEATGVGYGLGQVIMLGRNTFNPSLVFFTIVLIGLLGYGFDWLMHLMQRQLLYWAPSDAKALRGL